VEQDRIESLVKDVWSWERGKESTIYNALREYITIPNDSPDFDPNWSQNGHMDNAVDLLVDAVKELKTQWGNQGCKVDDITIEVLGYKDRPEYDETGSRRTPLIYINIPAFGSNAPDSTVLLYGHMDKQPEMLPWNDGLEPRIPVLRGNRLYGRGSADNGYAIFSAFTAVMALRTQNTGHAHCVIIIEACEESGSLDLPYYITKLQKQIGMVSLIVCLDSGSGNYDQLWITTSLRGIVNFWVKVHVMTEGVHSGKSSGIVPSSFRIARQLISRLENEATGEIIPSWLKVDIPAQFREQAQKTATILDHDIYAEFPFVNNNVQPVTENLAELLLNRTWRPQLSITGIQGLPATQESAGNTMLPYTRLKLSLRLPPTLNAEKAAAAVVGKLTQNPPYNAVVTISDITYGNGWAAPTLAPWLERATKDASIRFFRSNQNDISKEALYMGEGGSIPFMGLFGKLFPEAQFMITGVLGPHSNAHGPNEFLDLLYAQRVTMSVAYVLAAQYEAMQT